MGSTPENSRGFLVNCALTCKAFSNPALDLLWQDMADIRPLFRLFPAFAAERRTMISSDSDGLILNPDIDRFNQYAHRIRSFAPLSFNRIHIAGYLRILQECGRSCILPNLQILSLQNDWMSKLPMLTCSSLTSVEITIGSDGYIPYSPPFYAFIASVSSSTPNIHTLKLAATLTKPCLDGISQLSHLRKLHLDHRLPRSQKPLVVDIDWVLRLASLSCLQQLIIIGDLSHFANPQVPYCKLFRGSNFFKSLREPPLCG
ncbi:hypothetical protein CPB83DRAFT_861057 [Crepidotus variabilis]|uniref:Uncharacterized protein n=1 Tax=Crepidotus variabilis TaxID=179855 RepID=A0A9P6E8P8_9AGAR|nr:hypothetical protein CPB83DRAFT_861057 [Crepidotus variabilis]